MKNSEKKETFTPPPNVPPGADYKSKGRFLLRRIADLQVASVLHYLQPWLSGISGEVLEVGCGAQPYRFMVPKACTYHGLDWQGAEQHFQYKTPDTIYYDGGKFPFADNTFDYLFHTEVLEHVYDKEFFLSECSRVLKPSGSLFFSVPFQARYHYIPNDFWRFTPAALERLLSDNRFYNIKILPRGNDITVAAYKVISVIYRWLQSGVVGKALGVCFSPLVIIALMVGHLAMKTQTGSTDDCLGYVVIAQAKE